MEEEVISRPKLAVVADNTLIVEVGLAHKKVNPNRINLYLIFLYMNNNKNQNQNQRGFNNDNSENQTGSTGSQGGQSGASKSYSRSISESDQGSRSDGSNM